MVLVDFTLAERWRIFGELSLAPAPPKSKARVVTVSVASQRAPATLHIDPQESVARSHAQAALMQRML